MSGMNRVIICGRLGRDPELRNAGETQIVNFSVATSEKYKDKETTEWHNIVFFGKTAEVITKYFRKGSEILIEGRLSTRSWEDRSTGEKKQRTEIIGTSFYFVGAPGTSKEVAASPRPQFKPQNQVQPQNYEHDGEFFDDGFDLPF